MSVRKIVPGGRRGNTGLTVLARLGWLVLPTTEGKYHSIFLNFSREKNISTLLELFWYQNLTEE